MLFLHPDIMNMEYTEHRLENGIRLIHMWVPNIVAHCGLMINAGSRDEEDEQHGMAHFIEHMFFKGTTKRKAYHILSRLEDRGGELNAYTTKEETVIHASFLKEDYSISLEVISDIAFNSIFPEKEIKKEKEVILEEINSYKDTPSELIFDDFEELVFEGDALGRNILGSQVSLKAFSKESIQDFIRANYYTDQMVVCSVGNISEKRIIYLFEKYFSHIESNTGTRKRLNKNGYKPRSRSIDKGTWQNHCIIGNIAYNIQDNRRIGMYLLNNVLGGQGLNSRLNLSLREKNGFAYNVESSYHPYNDTGIFLIYFGTEGYNLERSTTIALKELKQLREKALGTIQLSKAKQQIKGNLARAYENHESYMLSMAKSLLVYEKIDPPEEIYRKIDMISSGELLEIAGDVFDENKLSRLIYR
ncbi:MAG: pitrilysin family protein [Marinilabiliaceae bacterium]|nr:pitrilysin family protein [Marinilabiliaceae bacterium]